MSKLIKLMEFIQHPLSEVGDLKNIRSYEFHIINSLSAKFKTKLGHNVNVDIIELNVDYEDIIVKHSPSIQKNVDKTIYYNIDFTVEGLNSQYQKTNISYLLKILKTVTNTLTELILKNDVVLTNNPKKQHIYTIFPESKFGEMLTDKQKYALYKVILAKNLPRGYRMDDNVEFNLVGIEYNGFAITKK